MALYCGSLAHLSFILPCSSGKQKGLYSSFLLFFSSKIYVFFVKQARKLQERGWQPRWFRKDEDGCYCYMGGYWDARERKNWDGIPDIFGQSTDPSSCLAEE